ncbi:MAG: L,D-transpeptidase, partial [Candidatus Colwellbacteria bacterium]|nr:L,D-transpeptidase [Candidatus Colwellbacteria bacterium]
MIKKFFSINIPIGIVIVFFMAILVGFGAFIKIFDRTETANLFLGDIQSPSDPLEFGTIPALGDFDFFTKVRDRFIIEEADFVEANLSEMSLKVYLKGEIEKEVKILTKGREGSWWETPAGIYQIESKEESHFSSFGRVYQPWSMAFQGNFFIHGWPYYQNGEPVSST